jgi:hypothetical protein
MMATTEDPADPNDDDLEALARAGYMAADQGVGMQWVELPLEAKMRWRRAARAMLSEAQIQGRLRESPPPSR